MTVQTNFLSAYKTFTLHDWANLTSVAITTGNLALSIYSGEFSWTFALLTPISCYNFFKTRTPVPLNSNSSSTANSSIQNQTIPLMDFLDLKIKNENLQGELEAAKDVLESITGRRKND